MKCIQRPAFTCNAATVLEHRVLRQVHEYTNTNQHRSRLRLGRRWSHHLTVDWEGTRRVTSCTQQRVILIQLPATVSGRPIAVDAYVLSFFLFSPSLWLIEKHLPACPLCYEKAQKTVFIALTSISALFFFKSAHDGANISTNAPVLHLATHSVVPFRFQPIGQNCRQSQDSIQYQRVLDGGAESEEDEINTVRRSGTRNGRDQAEPSGPQKHRRPMTRRAHIG